MKPLEDIRVLSVTVFLAGPFLGMTLARFGAEVIKIEVPGNGDPIREIGPFTGPGGINAERETPEDLSIRFLKRSEGVNCITLNLKVASGRKALHALVKQADIVLEGFRPGVARRLQIRLSPWSASFTLPSTRKRCLESSRPCNGRSGHDRATTG